MSTLLAGSELPCLVCKRPFLRARRGIQSGEVIQAADFECLAGGVLINGQKVRCGHCGDVPPLQYVAASNTWRPPKHYITRYGLVTAADLPTPTLASVGIQGIVDAAAAEQEQLIAEALSMKEDGYIPVEQLPAKSFPDLVKRDSLGLCRCTTVELMQRGCACGGK
jgi:hypothetical protein